LTTESTRRFALGWMAPPLLVAAVVLLPVILGQRAFFLRDVFSVHLEMRWALAEGLAEGALPLVDPYRGGGQPLAGNPNAVALYPTALAHLALPFFAAFNLHLWLHLLLAPFGLYWLARELGLERRAAWVAGVAWGTSGFVISQLAFFNLLAGVVLAPALAAAAVRAARRRREGLPAGRALAATALLWALELLAGDPQTAAAAGVAAAALALAELPWRRGGAAAAGARPDGPAAPRSRDRLATAALLAVAVAAGTLLALPQLVQLLAILPASGRAAGFDAAMRGAGSLDPRQLLGWLLPFPFGRPDLVGPGGFWGHRFHQGSWPFYFTLYPGLAALALAAGAGRAWRLPGAAGRAGRRGWALIAAGAFFALGAFNPLAAALLALPGLDATRYPLKWWLWGAMGLALLAGAGWSRASGSGGGGGAESEAAAGRAGGKAGEAAADAAAARRRMGAVLLGLAALFAALWLVLRLWPGSAGVLHGLMPPGAPEELAAAERLRWTGLAATSAGAALVLAALVPLIGRRPALGGGLLVTLHAALQLTLLAPAMATEPTAPYLEPPPVLAAVPADARVVQGSFEGLFGGATLEGGELPAPEVRWIFRRGFVEAYPFAGALHGRRYDLDTSPEWLDTAALRLAEAAVQGAPDDAVRLRLLAAWGIDRLLLQRPLDAAAREAGLAEELAVLPSVGRRVRVYALPAAAPEAHLATGLLRLPPAAPPRAAAALLADPRFRPGRDVVLPQGEDRAASDPGGEPGRVRVLTEGPELLVARTAAAGPGVLVWQRARLPLHRARVDGEPVEPLTVNLYRVGVPVPPGEHVVRVEVDRRPLAASAAGSLLGAVLLAGLLFAGRRSHRPAAAPTVAASG
jgi:hypothetical protein